MNDQFGSDRQSEDSASLGDKSQKISQQAGEENITFINSNRKMNTESELQQEEINQLRALNRRDREARVNEQAHAAVC